MSGSNLQFTTYFINIDPWILNNLQIQKQTTEIGKIGRRNKALGSNHRHRNFRHPVLRAYDTSGRLCVPKHDVALV